MKKCFVLVIHSEKERDTKGIYTNVLKTAPVNEPKKLMVYDSLIESRSNR